MIVGDQLPYSGKLLNATMNRHAESNGIPYVGIEMRQDLVGDAARRAAPAEAASSRGPLRAGAGAGPPLCRRHLRRDPGDLFDAVHSGSCRAVRDGTVGAVSYTHLARPTICSV